MKKTLRISTPQEHLATLVVEDGELRAEFVAEGYDEEVTRWLQHGFTGKKPRQRSILVRNDDPGFLEKLKEHLERTTRFHRAVLSIQNTDRD